MSSRKLLWLLLVAGVAVYFVSLGNSAIWDANEAYYVETPREMLESGDFVNPTFNYQPRFNKPVLSYWIVAALYKVFGVSVTVQRFGIALGALIIIACAYVLASVASRGLRVAESGRGSGAADREEPGSGTSATRLPPHATRDTHLALAGAWAAAGLAATPRLLMFARRIFIDIWLTAFMALTLTFFALSEARPERRRRYLLLMYAAIGFGVLTKGPVAVALPGMAFALYLLVRREPGRIREMMLPAGLLVVAAIVTPWYAALHHQHGWMYIRSFLIAENVERFTSGLGVQQHRGPWFYLPVVLSDSFPWSLLLPLAAVLAWKGRSLAYRHPGEGKPVETLLWCWIGSIVVFFSLSAGKQDLYIFPIVPAVAALGGLAIARGAVERKTLLSATLAVGGALLAIAGGVVLYLFEAAGRVYALESSLIVGVIGLVGGAGALLLGILRKPSAAALTLLAAMVAVNWTFVLRALPEFERYKPVPEFSRVLAARLQPGDVVAHYQVSLPSMAFYLRRHVDQYFDDPPFVAAVLSPSRVYAVLSDEDYATLKPRIGARTCIIDRRPTFDVKLKRVLARQPLPELLLITNQCQ
jgi:4-amino-4-deoxy-L-arabinose transferase-like glycosyltransferase